MSDYDKFARAYETGCLLQSVADACNKDNVFDALNAAGVTSVIVEFDGEGDSGQIESVSAYVPGCAAALPETTVTVFHVLPDAAKLDSSDIPLVDAIETLCYAYLSDEHDGWEIEDGAFGTFGFDVGKRTVTLDFNARVSDFYTTTHTF